MLLRVVIMNCIHFEDKNCYLSEARDYTPTDSEKKEYCQNPIYDKGFRVCPRVFMYNSYLEARYEQEK